jgi:putative RecB family exonuclease
VTVYSHSRLSSFENCPRQFYFRYVERVPIETESVEAFLGKRVHEVLERLNRFVGQGLVPSLGKVLARFRSMWEEQYAPERVRIVRAENEAGTYRELGERCLANFYRRNYPFDREESLGIEEHVAFVLDADGRYRMQGVVDRIARAADGAIEIHDYKTGRWVPTQQALDEDRQLALYQIALAERYGDASIRLVWHYLSRDQVRVSTRSPEQLTRLRDDTARRIDEIEAEQSFAPRTSSLCGWCEFRALCPAMASAAEPAEAVSVERAARPRAVPVAPPAPSGGYLQLRLL